MSSLWSRLFSGSVIAIYGFIAVVGPAGLHDLLEHRHHTAPRPNVEPIAAADSRTCHHHKSHHHAEHRHGDAAETGETPPGQATGGESGHHHHLPGDDENCLICQYMATSAQPVSPIIVPNAGEIVVEIGVIEVPLLFSTVISSTWIRGPPAIDGFLIG